MFFKILGILLVAIILVYFQKVLILNLRVKKYNIYFPRFYLFIIPLFIIRWIIDKEEKNKKAILSNFNLYMDVTASVVSIAFEKGELITKSSFKIKQKVRYQFDNNYFKLA